jgi:hypothetical protein
MPDVAVLFAAGVGPLPASGGVPSARSALVAAAGTFTLHASNSLYLSLCLHASLATSPSAYLPLCLPTSLSSCPSNEMLPLST